MSPEWFSIVKKIQHRIRVSIMYVSHHSAASYCRSIVPGATDRSDRRTFFLNFHFSNCFVFSFSFLFCPDDDCRKTVEMSAYLLLSISSGVNDLL